ncbi:MAG: tetratricopeptide repeat protein [Bacteroidetes bacterium]|nr:tetratricopeptide repeat protein [Bacteroidota bacterium]
MNNALRNWMTLSLVATAAMSCGAQNKAINTAEYELNAGTPENFVTAKEEIDKAYANPTTSNNPRMWLVRSQVYSSIFDKKGNELLAPLSADAGYTAAYSMMQFHKSPEKKKAEDIETAGPWTTNAFSVCYNESISVIEAKKYTRAIDYYKVMLYLYDKLDTQSVNALERQTLTKKYLTEKLAYLAAGCDDQKLKVEVLQEIVDGGSKLPAVFESLSKAYLEKGDTATGEKIVREGLKRAPSDPVMFQVLVNFFVTIKKEEKLYEDVTRQIEAAPDSKLYYTRGYLNEKKGDYDKATADYKKAVEMDEWNYDANFNYGLALLKYESNKLYDAKSKAKPADKPGIDAQLKKLFTDARSYLERAAENKSYDVNDQLNIYKAMKSANLELDDKEGVAKCDEMIKALEASK